MAMIVQHNVTAMNANRNLNVTTNAQAKSTEKLSTGYKINRAADDASGLSISEKMRRQIRGLTQASSNAQDGISAVQTAEGALTEVHDMLQRMDELATKASNGTLSADDRQNVQDEIDNLLTEIDRVSETTKFNETFLLSGSDSTKNVYMKAHDAGLEGTLVDDGNGTATFKASELTVGQSIKIGGTNYTIANASTVKAVAKDGGNLYKTDGTVDNTSYTSVEEAIDAGVLYKTIEGDTEAVDGDLSFNFDTATKTFTVSANSGVSFTQVGADNKSTTTVAASNIAKVTAGSTVYAGDSSSAASYSTTSALSANTVYYKDSGTTTGALGGAATANQAKTAFLAAQDGKKVFAGNKLLTVGTDIDSSNAETYFTFTSDNTDGTWTAKTGTVMLSDTAASDFTCAYDSTTTYGHVYTSLKGKDLATADDLEMSAGNKVTKSDAYKLMAEELIVANQIGVDSPTSVTVDNADDGTFTIHTQTAKVARSLDFNLHVGSDADMTNKISVSLEKMDAKYLGIQKLDVVGTVTDAAGNKMNDGGKAATYAIDAIEDAIKKVSNQRSALGAVQNRLEHTIKNLDNVVENTSAAESEIRDTNMATEMVAYSKNNILAQAGQSMLAQANQSNQGILSLLG